MSDLITCPAPLRANSPAALVQDVYVSAPGYGEVALLRKGERVTVIEVADTFARVALRSPTVAPATGSASWLTYPVEVSALAVDLTDATGRAHVDRWIIVKRGSRGAAAILYVTPDGAPGQRHIVVRIRYQSDCWPAGGFSGSDVLIARDIPALAELDPDDKRLLPDGSSMLAALVRKVIVEHLLTQRSAK